MLAIQPVVTLLHVFSYRYKNKIKKKKKNNPQHTLASY